LASTVLGLCYVPESPRWLMTKGKHGKALRILRLAAKQNGKDPMELFPLNTKLIDDEEAEENSNFCNLLAPQWRRTTLLLWATWAGMYRTNDMQQLCWMIRFRLEGSASRAAFSCDCFSHLHALFLLIYLHRIGVCLLWGNHYRHYGFCFSE
jgi:hypothetical protein